MENIKKSTRNKGITLIALVITVVVMLILAGVAISAITDGSGLFSKTIAAKDEYERNSAIEKLNVKLNNLDIQTVFDTGEIATLEDLKKWTDNSLPSYYDKEITSVAVIENEAVVKMDGYTFNLDGKLNITHVDGTLIGGDQGPTLPGTSTMPGKKSEITVKLASGMVPVTYNEEDKFWYVATKEQIDNGTWFEYVDTSKEGQANSSKWANVMLRDNLKVEGIENSNTATLEEMYGKKITSEGSMFVWIPRYAYKIESGYHTNEAGPISVKFLNTNNTYKDGSSTSTLLTNPLAGADLNSSTVYKVHPAFTITEEDGTVKELEGIWVGKFEASSANASFTATQAGNVLTSNTVIVRTVGNVSSWRSINRNNIFLNCLNMNSEINASIYGISTNKGEIVPHLIKNTEWGAAAYLAHSVYGRNGTEITINGNSSYLTGAGNYKTNVLQSTTGNVYGIYDMSGGAWEHVAAYVDSTKGGTVANGYLTGAGYGKALYDAEDKYKDVYEVGKTNDYNLNYARASKMYGDGVFETSGGAGRWNGGQNVGYYLHSWNGDYSLFPFSSHPFFYRGGNYFNGAGAGLFAFSHGFGEANDDRSFRVVLFSL